MALHKRLLQDIAEFKTNPYPNIVLCMQDDLQKACLLLTPETKKPLHLTVIFGKDYPLSAPQVTIQSKIEHPNIFGSYICASILNTTEGYTSAYTLKGIAIQLLSFFSSERIEQTGGGYSIELADYHRSSMGSGCGFTCVKCGFGGYKIKDKGYVIVGEKVIPDPFARKFARQQKKEPTDIMIASNVSTSKNQNHTEIDRPNEKRSHQRLIDLILALPDELVLLILNELDTEDLLAAAKVCSRIGEFLRSYDTIRMRELQCFCLKESFMNRKLGVGVHVSYQRREGTLGSEFDLLSQQAFQQFRVRRSIQGLRFKYWLPLPISRRHWRSVRADVDVSLATLIKAASLPANGEPDVRILYSFMNDVVVKLSREAEQHWDGPKSTLTHASEKAVESYFGLFHLLLCLATEDEKIVRDANRRMLRFLDGFTSKGPCPNLGQLLVTVLISDGGLTEALTLAIIKEAILRNVVWMLDNKGAGMADLSYIEPSAISDYRLQKTFEASKVSYRLLMFLALFYRTARVPGKSIVTIRDEMFDRHGAPPKATAEKMSAEIRQIRAVNNFPGFFKVMGLKHPPSKENMCTFLKRTIEDSVKMGYSCQPFSQDKILALRKVREPGVEHVPGVVLYMTPPSESGLSFFPKKQGKGGR